MYPTYLFMECVYPLKNDVDYTVPKEPKIGMFLKTICQKNGANILTLCQGQMVDNRGNIYINISRCILD